VRRAGIPQADLLKVEEDLRIHEVQDRACAEPDWCSRKLQVLVNGLTWWAGASERQPGVHPTMLEAFKALLKDTLRTQRRVYSSMQHGHSKNKNAFCYGSDL
jgi:hypothetical protein